MRLLLEHGADPRIPDSDGKTARGIQHLPETTTVMRRWSLNLHRGKQPFCRPSRFAVTGAKFLLLCLHHWRPKDDVHLPLELHYVVLEQLQVHQLILLGRKVLGWFALKAQ